MEDTTLIESLGILSIFSIFVGLFCLLIWAILWWVIFKKAGFYAPFILGICMAIPLVNVVLFLVFALGEWPILRAIK